MSCVPEGRGSHRWATQGASWCPSGGGCTPAQYHTCHLFAKNKSNHGQSVSQSEVVDVDRFSFTPHIPGGREGRGERFAYHGSSAATSGLLKILAALYLLLVGIGSPAGV
jgi:hypothetical protein